MTLVLRQGFEPRTLWSTVPATIYPLRAHPKIVKRISYILYRQKRWKSFYRLIINLFTCTTKLYIHKIIFVNDLACWIYMHIKILKVYHYYEHQQDQRIAVFSLLITCTKWHFIFRYIFFFLFHFANTLFFL